MHRAWRAVTIAWLALSACEAGERGRGEADVPASPEALASGRALFLEHCAICHGEKGDGHGPRRGSLSRPPPDFRSPIWRDGRTRAEVEDAIRNGVPGTDMPAWRQLDDEQVEDLAAWVLEAGRRS